MDDDDDDDDDDTDNTGHGLICSDSRKWTDTEIPKCSSAVSSG